MQEKRKIREDRIEMTGRKDRKENRTHSPERQRKPGSQLSIAAVVEKQRTLHHMLLAAPVACGMKRWEDEDLGGFNVGRRFRGHRGGCVGGWGSDWARSAVHKTCVRVVAFTWTSLSDLNSNDNNNNYA
jgi:hypothetical protein